MTNNRIRVKNELISFHRESGGQLPSASHVSRMLNIPLNEVEDIYKQFRVEGFLFKTKKPSEEVVEHVKNIEEPEEPEELPEAIEVPMSEEPIVVNRTSEEKPKHIPHKENLLLEVVFSFISLSACVLSVYITNMRIQNFMAGPLGWLMAITIVLFIALSSPVIILLWRKGKYIATLGYTAIWIFVILYSMMTTVNVQFKYYEEEEVDSKEQLVGDTVNKAGYEVFDSEIEVLLRQIERTEREVEELRERRDNLNSRRPVLLSDFESYATALLQISPTEEEKAYNNMAWRKRSAENSINELDDSIKTITEEIEEKNSIIQDTEQSVTNKRKSKQEYLQSNATSIVVETKEPMTFAQWFSSLIKIMKANMIDFLMTVIPALFIDIAAPLGLAVVTLLNESDEKKK